MDKEFINRLVAQVVSRIARQLGADGSRQTVLTICTGCGGDVVGATELIKNLLMKGYRTPLFFSQTAGNSYRPVLEGQLAGLPYSETVNSGQWSEWTTEFSSADALLVPLLSMNTLSRLALLMADAPHTHLLLHAVTQGKPVIIIRDSGLLSFDAPSPLAQEAAQRLKTVEQYGALVCNLNHGLSVVEKLFGGTQEQEKKDVLPGKEPAAARVAPLAVPREPSTEKTARMHSGRVLTGVAVSHAAQAGYDLVCEQGVVITPTAKDLLTQKRVKVLTR